MGEEIQKTSFTESDYLQFELQLQQETQRLHDWFDAGELAEDDLVGGFEIECWLLDQGYQPAARNREFLHRFNHELVTAELAQFNLEFNNQPRKLANNALSLFHSDLNALWKQAAHCASGFDDPMSLMMVGILPTLQPRHLGVEVMSEMRRYYALNEQIMSRRDQEPIHFEIIKKDHLEISSHTVMLESAATSLQIHAQVPASKAHHYYNASLLISAPLVAVAANSPFLFQHQLWDETRIPLFEHAIDTANRSAEIPRVSFGTGFIQKSILECFDENLRQFGILLPVVTPNAKKLQHLRLHNGAIWRWNRPLIGFDENNVPHVRIEHRVMAAGPTLIDMMANAAFYYGLLVYSVNQLMEGEQLPDFGVCKNNFYQAARDGLHANIVWQGKVVMVHELILNVLLDQAQHGLHQLGIDNNDIHYYLKIIEERTETRQNGAEWQRKSLASVLGDYQRLTEAYLKLQNSGLPVHQWDRP